jgi:hypothetical protein
VEGLSTLSEAGDQGLGVVGQLAAFAELAVAQGRPDRALRLAGSVQAVCAATGIHVFPLDRAQMDRSLETARRTLGEEAATAAWTSGQSMAMDQAVAYALAADAE